MNYIDVLKSIKYITKYEIVDGNIIAFSDIKEIHQLEWIILCSLYDENFNKNFKKIIVKNEIL